MEYKRLTERREEPLTMSTWAGASQELKIYNRLAELEDKVENGTLIELPCKLGTPVYCLCENDYVLDGEEKECTYTIKELGFEFVVFGLWKYGETLFLTREEAEKKLEDLEKQ